MKERIVADGAERLQADERFRTQLRELRESIRKRYASEFAAAGFLGRCRLQWRIAAEYRRERKRLAPSRGSLYLGRRRTNGKR